MDQPRIIDHQLILPKRIKRLLKFRFPFYRIPELSSYNDKIIAFSKQNNQLPFYAKFDINNDGKEEINLIQKSFIGGYGKLLIISIDEGRININRIKWNRPVNALYFDYLIDMVEPKKYRTMGFLGGIGNKIFGGKFESRNIDIKYPHIITKGYIMTRVVYWDGLKYCQEKVSPFE